MSLLRTSQATSGRSQSEICGLYLKTLRIYSVDLGSISFVELAH